MNTSRIGHSHAYIRHSACRICRTTGMRVHMDIHTKPCGTHATTTTKKRKRKQHASVRRSHADEVKLCLCVYVYVYESSHVHEGTIYTNAKYAGFEFGRWQCKRERDRERDSTRGWVGTPPPTPSAPNGMNPGAQSVCVCNILTICNAYYAHDFG